MRPAHEASRFHRPIFLSTLTPMRPGVATHLKRLILPVYLPMFLLSTGISAPIAAFPQYLAGLGASLATIGVIVSLRGIGNLISDLPGGMILSRGRLRPVMIVSFLVSGCAGLGLAFTHSIAVIGMLRLVTGFANSIVITAMMTYVRLTIPANVRGRALSMAGGSMRIGLLVAPVLGGFLIDRFGMPYAFLLRTACTLGAVGALMRSPDKSVGVPRTENKPGIREQAALVGEGMKGRWFAVSTVGTAVLLLSILRATRALALPLWGDALSLNATTIGAILSAGAIMDILLFVPAGMIMDRAGRKVAASICIGVFAVGLLLLPFTRGLAGFVIVSMIVGLGNGFGAGINMTLGTDLAPQKAVSSFLGLWRLFGDIGQSVGPALVGAIAAAVGLSASLFVTAGIGAVGLLVMAFVAPETLHMGKDETGDNVNDPAVGDRESNSRGSEHPARP
jgi:MFS family permease